MHTKHLLAAALLAFFATAATAEAAKTLPDTLDLSVGGAPWLRTMCAPFDPARNEETYKVYTHILDFSGKAPITKGPGGKYPHHRGLYIGWKDTLIDGVDYDTWHMSNSIQQLTAAENAPGMQTLSIDWRDREGNNLIQEKRIIRAHADGELRVIDFNSNLSAVKSKVELKGDLQHAGMHVRMAQEVAERDEAETKAKTTSKDSTSYILPEGAQSLPDDKVTGAWWVCCSFVVEGKRYWAVHMSAPDTPGGVPVYSIRKYARFGSFFEPTLEPQKPLSLNFRIIVSEKELDQKTCQALYDAYAKAKP